MKMQKYIVTLQFQYPAWNEVAGLPFEVSAKNKRDAIMRAKRQSESAGHSGPWVTDKGRQTFSAKEQSA
jgi:hypothetical protein